MKIQESFFRFIALTEEIKLMKDLENKLKISLKEKEMEVEKLKKELEEDRRIWIKSKRNK